MSTTNAESVRNQPVDGYDLEAGYRGLEGKLVRRKVVIRMVW